SMPDTLLPLMPPPAALDRLVYLVGPARGGTSIIHAAMNVHPRALVLPGITYFIQHLWRYRNSVHERLLREIMRLPNFWSEKALKARLDPERYAAFVRLVNRALAQRDFNAMFQLYPIVYALLGESGKDLARVACWHDKHNDWRGIGIIAKQMPAAKFIFVVRDPRSVALSNAIRADLKEGELLDYPSRQNLIESTLYWRLLVQKCLSFKARHPERAVVVRYEDFVEAPEATLNRIFAFTVGEPLAEEEITAGLAAIQGNATNDSAGRYRGITREPVARWKKMLQPEDIALIEALTAPTARKLGYDIARANGAFRNAASVGPRWRPLAKMLFTELYESRLPAQL
ncbi:MAG TPA: sulfotransferase, partial [Burkholderiales bacterium]|nr:sulfotransferase [Burkholderiales bacterium]